jgi:hypothetical protein
VLLFVLVLGPIAVVWAALWQFVPLIRRLGDRPGDAWSKVTVLRSGSPGGLVATVTVDNPGASSVLVGLEARGAWRLGLLREPLTVWVPDPVRRRGPAAGTMVGAVGIAESRTWQLPLDDFTGFPAVKVVVNLYQAEGRRRVLTHRLPHDEWVGAVNLRSPGH